MSLGCLVTGKPLLADLGCKCSQPRGVWGAAARSWSEGLEADMQGAGKAVGKAVGNSPCSSSSDVVFRLQKLSKDPPVWDAGRLWMPQCPRSPGRQCFRHPCA